MAMIPVEEARRRVLADCPAPDKEVVPLGEAAGRVLAADLTAARTQPPFAVSAMDGYALRAADAATAGAVLALAGEIPAGRALGRTLAPREAARIFTGAPVPDGADTILIQENASAGEGAVTVVEPAEPSRHIRRRGLDFSAGDVILTAGTRLGPAALGLAAAANRTAVTVARRPRVAILATGDELVPPGTEPGPHQIVASNAPSIAAVVTAAGGIAEDAGIVGDDPEAMAARVAEIARRAPDVLVTVGGASVGDHDLVRDVLGGAGLSLAFWRIAMRPGKPLLSGHIGPMRVLGLPGNPVSSLVCSVLFLAPLVEALSGAARVGPEEAPARLAQAVPQNGPRADYMRASIVGTADDGLPLVAPAPVQDSSMLGVLARSDALLVRPAGAPPAPAGDACRIIRL